MTTNEQDQKRVAYVAPSIEVIRMENEGVIAASGGVGGNESVNPGPMSSNGVSRGYNSASSSELEDLINDILTVEN